MLTNQVELRWSNCSTFDLHSAFLEVWLPDSHGQKIYLFRITNRENYVELYLRYNYKQTYKQ